MAIGIRFRCGQCRRWREGDDPCRACGQAVTIAPVTEPLVGCACCGGREFFLRKDFPQKLGMGLVIIFALVASLFYYQQRVMATFATLAALVVIDAVIFLFVGKVVVCYKCRAEYRGFSYNSRLEGFDLATAEKYRTE